MGRLKRSEKMERKALIVDASVVVKWFTKEEDKEKAVKIRDDFVNGNIEIVFPDLILYEIANALRYNPNFNSDDVNSAIESLLDMEIDIVVPQSSTLKKAIEISFERNLTIYDSFYIALASEIDYGFVTSDEQLYKKVKDLGFVYLLGEM